jgi:carbonic anhydrase
MESCRTGKLSAGEARYVVQCNDLEVGMSRAQGEVPKQAPFAVVVGCSDSRVPIEMLFGQGFNDLFMIRVPGNVMGNECQGSIDFALGALSHCLRVIVVLGHSGCGAVTGAVDAYLEPLTFRSKPISPMLTSILHRIYLDVREAANALKTVWGPQAREVPGYREALIKTAVCLNAAQTAFDLRMEVEDAGKGGIEILYSVFNLHNHQVAPVLNTVAPFAHESVRLAYAPRNPPELQKIVVQMAELLKSQLPAGTPSK